MLQFTPTTLDMLDAGRTSYFDSLACAQDMHSESMISWMPGATCHSISQHNTPVGYVILNSGNEVVEFYLHDDWLTRKEAVFSHMLQRFGVKTVYCKSFDHVLLSCCHRLSSSSKLVGYLFQDLRPASGIVLDSTISVRLATRSDVPFLNSFENELLDQGEEIAPYVDNNSVYMFMKGDELAGCGYLFNIIANRIHYDVGVWVNQEFRGKGYGAQIIAHLMDYCIGHGWVPTAGCAEDNAASRRTLEKCGFVSKYCLLAFECQT